jgi:hypothetical protein
MLRATRHCEGKRVPSDWADVGTRHWPLLAPGAWPSLGMRPLWTFLLRCRALPQIGLLLSGLWRRGTRLARGPQANQCSLFFRTANAAPTPLTGTNLDVRLGADLSSFRDCRCGAPETGDAIGSNGAASAPQTRQSNTSTSNPKEGCRAAKHALVAEIARKSAKERGMRQAAPHELAIAEPRRANSRTARSRRLRKPRNGQALVVLSS